MPEATKHHKTHLTPPRLPGVSRVTQAIAIRDHLLPLVLAHGKAEEHRAGELLLITGIRWSPSSEWTLLVWSPWTRPWACPCGTRMVAGALDVWFGGRKVLSFKWTDAGAVELVSMQRGPWQQAAMLIEAPSP